MNSGARVSCPALRAHSIDPQSGQFLMRHLLSLTATTIVCSSGYAEPARLWTFSGGSTAAAYAVSPEGSVAGGGTRLSGSGPSYSFRWTNAEGLSLLDDPDLGLIPREVRDISALGQVIVGGEGSGGQAYRWENGEATFMGFLPGMTRSRADGVSADGQLIVGWSGTTSSNSGQAWRWTDSTGMERLSLPTGWGATNYTANAVSEDASTIVGHAIDPFGDRRGVVWSDSGFATVELPDELGDTHALNVSGDGRIVVGTGASPRGGREAFMWSSESGGMWLGDLLPVNYESFATAASGDGSVVVGIAGTDDAFIWDAINGMRSLQSVLIDAGVDMTGITLTAAHGISLDGRTICGEALVDGQGEIAFVATIPSPASLGVFALCGLVRQRRRCDPAQIDR